MTETNLGRIIGPEGPAGKSAYQYAQDGGFEGSEQEFTEKLVKEYPSFDDLRAAAPVNLLDNSNFLNPVNQREVTSGTLASTSSYCIDRWRRTSADGTQFAITDTGLTLATTGNGGIRQLMETQARSDQSFTAAVKLSNGEIIIASGIIGEITSSTTVFAQTTSGVTTIILQKRILDGLSIITFNILVNASSVTFEWAALYPGEYTVETLPEYRPKGYGVELAECLRYFERIGGNGQTKLGSPTWLPNNTKGFACTIPCYPKRIEDPTVTLQDVSNYRMGFFAADTGEGFGANFVSEFKRILANRNQVFISGSMNAVTWQNCFGVLEGVTSGSKAYIDISCDL